MPSLKPSERAAAARAAEPKSPVSSPRRPTERQAEARRVIEGPPVKTTIHVPPSLHKRLRVYTAITGTSMNTFLLAQAERALEAWERKNGGEVAQVKALEAGVDAGGESDG